MPERKKHLRTLAVIAVAAILVAGGCNRGGDNDAEETLDVTEPPEQTPSIEAVADFQLVGLIDEAFAGQGPDIDLPDDTGFEPTETTDPESTAEATPAGTPVGSQPLQDGILRLTLEDVSEDLTQACGLEPEDVVEVFWTTNTYFEPADVLEDIEDEIEDRVAAITGAVFRGGDDDDGGLDLNTPQPTVDAASTATPAGTAAADAVPDTDCILVAEQVGFGTTVLPTPRPVIRRTAAPTPVRTATPSPTRTPTPRPNTPTPQPTTTVPATVNPSPT